MVYDLTMSRSSKLYIGFILIFAVSCKPSNEVRVYDNEHLSEVYYIDKDSLRHGQATKYYPAGGVLERANYIHGLLDGERWLYYEGGTPEIREKYCLNIFCDTLVTYHPNGVKKFEGVYHQGIMSGLTWGYYNTGEIKEEVTFLDNEENGPFVEYYKNGSPQWVGTYRHGPNEIGELIQLSENGDTLKVMFCDSLSICKTIWPSKD